MIETSTAPRVRAVLQSRLSSERLPAKAMLHIAGRPMVVLAAQRAASAGAEVVVATSDQPEDDVLAKAVRHHGIAVVRGSLNDPVSRFVRACEDLDDVDVVVRLTADNVVPDGDVVTTVSDAVLDGRGYARVGGDDPALPYGIAAEAFRVGDLRRVAASALTPHEREHVTPRLRTDSGDHRITLVNVDPAWGSLRCTVDTFDDFVVVASLFEPSGEDHLTPWRSLVALLARRTPASHQPVVRRPNAIDQGALVLGTAQLGGTYGVTNVAGQPDLARSHAILRAAANVGVTHLDTARAYGDAEERIGTLLRRGLGERLRIVTKLRPLDEMPGGAPPAWGRAMASASIQESLLALRGARIDALLVHRAADWRRPGVRDVLVELRASGQVHAVGASVSTPEELVALLSDPLLTYVQLPFNMLDRRWLDAHVQQSLGARPDVVVTTRSTYLQGLLITRDARWPPGHDVLGRAVTQKIEDLVSALGRASRADLCLAYVLAQPWVTSVVLGAELPEQVLDSGSLASTPPLSPTEVEAVHQYLSPGPATLVNPAQWRTRD